MNNDLTILIFLKDRPEFTKRLCKYLSLISYPYEIFFADGSINDINECYLKNSNNKDLKFKYTYKRYPKDTNLKFFYEKCYLSLLEIKTKYVMLADNDDFLIPEGQKKCIDFLDNNPDYIGCNGKVSGLVVKPNAEQAFGKYVQYLSYYCNVMDVSVCVDQKSSLERISSYLGNFYSIFYSVFRTDSVLHTFKKIREFKFSDLGIFELFFSYMQLAQGKVNTIEDITYVRQKGSSQSAATQKDWFYRLFYTNWMSDCREAINYVSEIIAKNEGYKKEFIFEKMYSDLVNRMRDRYLLNGVYIFKNITKLFEKEFIKLIIFNKLFKKFPWVAEWLSFRYIARHECSEIFETISRVVRLQYDETLSK